jgi:hypothetical protein
VVMISAGIASLDDISEVMFDDEIFDRTNDDFSPKRDGLDIKKANLNGWVFIGGYVQGKIASLFSVYGSQMHFWVLKPYRKHARELLNKSLELWPHDVWVKIPSLYQTVINFAKKAGFKEFYCEESSYMKNGKLYNNHYLVRSRWAE